MSEQLHLVLTHHWYDETQAGRKRIEYRRMTPHWMRLIYEQRDKIKRVRFARGYTRTTQSFAVDRIDIGPCPYLGWDDNYFRIHFSDLIK
jgi:hypothetical protein